MATLLPLWKGKANINLKSSSPNEGEYLRVLSQSEYTTAHDLELKHSCNIHPYLNQELHHFSVDETMNCFSVHMSNEVPCFKSCFMCRSTIFHVLTQETFKYYYYYHLFFFKAFLKGWRYFHTIHTAQFWNKTGPKYKDTSTNIGGSVSPEKPLTASHCYYRTSYSWLKRAIFWMTGYILQMLKQPHLCHKDFVYGRIVQSLPRPYGRQCKCHHHRRTPGLPSAWSQISFLSCGWRPAAVGLRRRGRSLGLEKSLLRKGLRRGSKETGGWPAETLQRYLGKNKRWSQPEQILVSSNRLQLALESAVRCSCNCHEPGSQFLLWLKLMGFSLPALGTSRSCPARILYMLAACALLLAYSHSIKWNSQQVTCWANFPQIYGVLSSLSHYLFNNRCSDCNSGHAIALIYFNLLVRCMHIFLNALIDLPLGIIRDRVPVEIDFGTFGTAPVFSATLLGRRELAWGPWSVEVWRVPSGLSTPSPLGVNWSRCSEKLPNNPEGLRCVEHASMLNKYWLSFFFVIIKQ